MQSNTKNLVLNVLLMAWLIICLILFIYVNRIGFVQLADIANWKAFVEMLTHISPLRYLFDLLGAVLGVLLFSLSCLSFGLFFLQKWIQPQPSKLALGVTAFLIGEIFFSLIFLTVISLYRLTPPMVAISISLGFLVGFPVLKTFIAHLVHRPSWSLGFELSEQIIFALVAAGLILGLSLSTTRLGYDATTDYFSHAKIMAVSQLPVVFHPKHFFIVSEFHPGILFTALIQVFGDQSARLLPWASGIAILIMGLALGQELGLTPRARLWFLTLMATSTAFVDLLGDGKIELISTAPILAAAYWMARSIRQPTRGTFALIGLLAGFGFISRIYNIFLLSVFITLFYISQVYAQKREERFDSRRFIQLTLWILPPILILGTFHLLENWFFLKNPFAPLIYARGLSASDWQWQFDPANLTLYRLLYPIAMTFMNSAQSLGNISPLLVGFLPFLLVKRVRENLHNSPLMYWFSLAAVLTLVLWITFSFTVVEIRYVLYLWVILFLTTAQVLESAMGHVEVLTRSLLRPLLIIFLAIMCVRTLMLAVIAYFPLDKTGNYYCADGNLCTLLGTINQSAAPGDRVLVLHAYRYYLRPDLFACSSRVDEYSTLEALARQNSPNFWVEVYRQGYHFIMFEQHLSEQRYQFGKLPSLDTVPGWIQIKVLYSTTSGNQLVYQLETVNPPIQPQTSCKQDSAGQWQLVTSAELPP